MSAAIHNATPAFTLTHCTAPSLANTFALLTLRHLHQRAGHQCAGRQERAEQPRQALHKRLEALRRDLQFIDNRLRIACAGRQLEQCSSCTSLTSAAVAAPAAVPAAAKGTVSYNLHKKNATYASRKHIIDNEACTLPLHCLHCSLELEQCRNAVVLWCP